MIEKDPKSLFFVSDTHWCHANIIKYCHRKFSDVEEMNQFMAEKWNEVVKPSDTIIHLGDVFMGRFKKFLESNMIKSLNGYKILIKGNHDRSADYMKQLGFNEVYNSLHLNLPNNKVALLKHIPQSDLEGCDYQFHGHTHSRFPIVGQYVNFTVEAWNYKPVSLSKLMKVL